MSIADELQKIEALHRDGSLSDDEYARAKEQVLQGRRSTRSGANAWDQFGISGNQEEQTRQWGLLLHLSVFAGYIIPIAGFVLPIVIWQIKKKDLPDLDDHGKIVVNWMISSTIYVVLCVLLTFVLIGIPLLFLVLVCSLIFPIVGGIKANSGEKWVYPMSFPFLT